MPKALSGQMMRRWICFLCDPAGKYFDIPKHSNYYEEHMRHYMKYHYVGD